jgi:diguanylate cyclase
VATNKKPLSARKGTSAPAARAKPEGTRAGANTVRAKAKPGAVSNALLREANEHLVVAAVRAQTMAEEAERATAQIAYMAEHDYLTGLPNRSLLTDRLAQAITLAQRHGQRVALMYLDIDHFKQINDTHGHTIGDALLQSTAKRLQACVRLSDTVCRQGGDEFIVLLADVEAVQDAARTAEKLINAMAQPHRLGGLELQVTLSIGISVYPDDGTEVETVLKNADVAMYHAKRSGRNNYQIYTPNINVRATARRSVEEVLTHALDQCQFVLYYQPKVNLDSGAITGAEALLRLQQADHSLVSPAQFVGIAEGCGLILPIGQWALREACRQMAAWLRDGLCIERIAVNVSPVELHSRDFLASVRSILADTGLDPRHLELELTESALLHDTEQMTTTLGALKALGVQLAVDDFGTGYSSLSYLRRFPIDTLKIDHTIVQDIDGDTKETAIVSAIIAMGRSLKMQVVAEGIETGQQLAYLQAQRCPEGQGHFFSRPVPAEEFAALLGTDRKSPRAEIAENAASFAPFAPALSQRRPGD